MKKIKVKSLATDVLQAQQEVIEKAINLGFFFPNSGQWIEVYTELEEAIEFLADKTEEYVCRTDDEP